MKGSEINYLETPFSDFSVPAWGENWATDALELA